MSINDGKSFQILRVGEKKLCLFQVIFILILEAEKKRPKKKAVLEG